MDFLYFIWLIGFTWIICFLTQIVGGNLLDFFYEL
jgi:hypothetical protein